MGKNPTPSHSLKRLREAAGMTQDQAAAAFGMSKGGYVKIEGSERGLKADRIAKAAEIFGVSKAEVMAEAPVESAPKRRRSPRPSIVASFDPDEPDRGDADYAPRMVEGALGRDVGEVPAGAILQVDVRLGMGGGGHTHVTDLMTPNGESYAAEGIKGHWHIPPEVVSALFRVPPHRIRCFESHGDSMVPTVANGDYVFVDIGHRVPTPPGVYALADSLGGVVLKRLEMSSIRGAEPVKVRIISDNPHHTPEDATLDDITITGRYLGRLTTS